MSSKIFKASQLDSIDFRKTYIKSGLAPLDFLLGGGLEKGQVSEWGIPKGRNGLRVINQFLSYERPLTLWVYNSKRGEIYPPTWASLGIDLSRIYFVDSSNPLKDLKPVFLEFVFNLIVLDRPECFRADDFAFISQKARQQGHSIVVTRDYFLSSGKGNPHVKTRMNCWFDVGKTEYRIQPIKGVRATKPLKIAQEHIYRRVG